jgi:CDP-glucose 4,6-dehydratase
VLSATRLQREAEPPIDLTSGCTLKILITGHTGFKGAWLGVLLKNLGHEISGLSLQARPTSLFHGGNLDRLYEKSFTGDVADYETVKSVLDQVQPDRIFHLAAQPLVRYSYNHPRETFQTNVEGTLNVLEAASQVLSNHASVIVITTDKVYKDQHKVEGYDESSPLGGSDPYSASKAMADILTQSWISCNPDMRIAIARAGNVIGGGDDSAERLLPDLISAFQNHKSPVLRNPKAVRPWQHVLDCIYGYWTLSENIEVSANRTAWNFGPEPESFAEVELVAEITARLYGAEARWLAPESVQPHETSFLTLNSDKAKKALSWRSGLNLERAIDWTVSWHKAVALGADPYLETNKQVMDYLEDQT